MIRYNATLAITAAITDTSKKTFTSNYVLQPFQEKDGKFSFLLNEIETEMHSEPSL